MKRIMITIILCLLTGCNIYDSLNLSELYLHLEETQLTFFSDMNAQNPAWSKDSKHLLYNKCFEKKHFEIWSMDLNGSNSKKIFGAPNSDAVILPGACWCPANDRICFSSDYVSNDEIWSMKSDGTDLRRITNDPAHDWEPSWSPDGNFIVFSSDRSGNGDLYVAQVDTPAVLQQITNNTAYDGAPSWSPDGMTIAFESDRTGRLNLFMVKLKDELYRSNEHE